jgi:hypothetical protein
MGDRNMFGGGNAQSLYTPMSEDEQEVLARLVESRDLHVHIVDWGWVHTPKATYGDLRIAIPISITFQAPAVPIPVATFTLELWTGAGLLLFRKEYDIRKGNQFVMVGAGFNFVMVWDIAIKHMDPAIVKAYKPGAIGLTSRWQDKDTGDFTHLGNSKLNSEQKAALKRLRQGEAKVGASDVRRLVQAKKK